MTVPDSADRLAEAPNAHVFRLWEELGIGLMEVECEAPDCGWKATFNPPISAEMKSQAVRFQREHQQASALLSELEAAQARLDKARKVHYPVNVFAESNEPPYMCGWRAVCNHSENAWPCETARALGLGEEADDA